MPVDLHLRGGELMIYAIIYSFSRVGGVYFGGIGYLAALSGLSKRSVLRVLASLMENKHIEKVAHGDGEGYRCTPVMIDGVIAVVDEDEDEDEDDGSVTAPDGEEETDIREILGRKAKPPKYAFHSVSHNDLVHMTEEQYSKLLELVNSEVLTVYICRLEQMMKNNGYRTFNPYKTIKKWILEDTAL